MAEIHSFGFFRHLRAEPNAQILMYRGGQVRRQGQGLSGWFLPWSTGIAEIPVDDRELQFLFHGRSTDFQDVTAQGVITYRLANATTVADRVDFTLDLKTGQYRKQPFEKLGLSLNQLAQQLAWAYMAETPVRDLLHHGTGEIRQRILAGLEADPGLQGMGIEIVSVRVSAVKPTAELEKALEAPMRERIQQEADDAVFERRARAVDKERAIEENELNNRIELARREEQLIQQQGANARRQAEEEAAAQRIQVEGAGARSRVEADAEADRKRTLAAAEGDSVRLAGTAEAETTRLLEAAKIEAELQRLQAYGELSPPTLFALAARELAGNLPKIDHLNLSPELLTPLLTDLLRAGSARLGRDGGAVPEAAR